MSSNYPRFDPLNPTPQESEDMFAGYRDAYRGSRIPDITSVAYEHGYRMGRNDKYSVVDDDQRKLAARARQDGWCGND
jgi:hypothetical protein